ncbi:thiamine phosphate synthase [Clostridium sp. Marseille-P2415]|uniref:thiamine phosphate synthase n=1 Tax=Clostridium sp. Marseille-P2415 TaxID=1805471 RepID=UPI0009884B7C|nr:thiamine phosphate synthase [Clostridium sp. Marseille-P2415]
MESNEFYHEIIAVTNRHLCSRPFLEQIESVCRQRPRALVLRENDMEEEEYERLARLVLPICETFRVPCILHSFSDTAKRLHVDKIHLPLLKLQEQGKPGREFSVIGTSVHSVKEARRAEELGAAYVIAGHIFETGCKPGVPPRGLDFLEEVCGAVSIPVYAIGGMQLAGSCLKEIKERGAAGMCVMSGLMKG